MMNQLSLKILLNVIIIYAFSVNTVFSQQTEDPACSSYRSRFFEVKKKVDFYQIKGITIYAGKSVKDPMPALRAVGISYLDETDRASYDLFSNEMMEIIKNCPVSYFNWMKNVNKK